ncbi:MAG: VOC family protein [Acidobacteriota bacterium]|nr:VOC family protein [Acidobacteriota bacterium]
MRLALVFAAAAASLCAQLAPPNGAGVSIGHIHLMSADPEAQKKLFVGALGAEVTHSGSLELLRLPGVFVIAGKARGPVEGSDGSAVPHFGFLVKDPAALHAKLAAAGLKFSSENAKTGQFMALFPDNVMIEFTPDASLDVPLRFHHIHIGTPDMERGRAWYVKTFGARSGSRAAFLSAFLPGGEVDFRKADAPQAPTKGRALDHIGFEVKGLEEFCKRLVAEGYTLDVPYREMPQLGGLKLAFLTDSDGVRIELTEGLAGR